MNICVFIGRMTKDPEVRQSQNGKSVASFSIALDTGYGENKKANFFNCVAFGNNADNIGKFFHKGDKIALECEAQQNVWEKDGVKQYSINFIVNRWEFTESVKPKQEWEEIPHISEEELPFS